MDKFKKLMKRREEEEEEEEKVLSMVNPVTTCKVCGKKVTWCIIASETQKTKRNMNNGKMYI